MNDLEREHNELKKAFYRLQLEFLAQQRSLNMLQSEKTSALLGELEHMSQGLEDEDGTHQ